MGTGTFMILVCQTMTKVLSLETYTYEDLWFAICYNATRVGAITVIEGLSVSPRSRSSFIGIGLGQHVHGGSALKASLLQILLDELEA